MTVSQAEAHRVDIESIGTAHVVQTVRDAGGQDVRTLLGQYKLTTGRPVLTQMGENHQLQFFGSHVGRPFRSRVL